MITFGLGLILMAGPALAGVLHAWHAKHIDDLHRRLEHDPLGARIGTCLERRHMHRACADCSMIAALQVAHVRKHDVFDTTPDAV